METNNEMLTKREIMDRLRIKSGTAWTNRRRALIRKGLFKDGKIWLMKAKDLESYVEEKRNPQNPR